jgi:hypothetical protein
MERLLLAVAAIVAVPAVTSAGANADSPPASDTKTNAVHYYVALGDSLAQGYQTSDTYPPYYYADGYVPRVYGRLAPLIPSRRSRTSLAAVRARSR